MTRSNRYLSVQAFVAVAGTGVAFAFLEAGAFRDIGFGTLQRMVTPAGLHSAAIGAGATAALLAPYIGWQLRRRR